MALGFEDRMEYPESEASEEVKRAQKNVYERMLQLTPFPRAKWYNLGSCGEAQTPKALYRPDDVLGSRWLSAWLVGVSDGGSRLGSGIMYSSLNTQEVCITDGVRHRSGEVERRVRISAKMPGRVALGAAGEWVDQLMPQSALQTCNDVMETLGIIEDAMSGRCPFLEKNRVKMLAGGGIRELSTVDEPVIFPQYPRAVTVGNKDLR